MAFIPAIAYNLTQMVMDTFVAHWFRKKSETAKLDVLVKKLKIDFLRPGALQKALEGFDAVISCLPYNFNKDAASAAYKFGVHYFDLTEDLETSRAIIKMGKKARVIMAPQRRFAGKELLKTGVQFPSISS